MNAEQRAALRPRAELQPPPVPLFPFPPQIEGDDGEEVVATDVIKQSGGISNGANGARTTFSAGVQFSISDPAFGKVSPASLRWLCESVAVWAWLLHKDSGLHWSNAYFACIA